MKNSKQIWLGLPKQLSANGLKTIGLLDITYDSGNASVPALICDVDLNNQTLREIYVVKYLHWSLYLAVS